jgi:hypothetical protein
MQASPATAASKRGVASVHGIAGNLLAGFHLAAGEATDRSERTASVGPDPHVEHRSRQLLHEGRDARSVERPAAPRAQSRRITHAARGYMEPARLLAPDRRPSPCIV